MGTYTDSFIREYEHRFGLVSMPEILELFFWYCRGNVTECDRIIGSNIKKGKK